MRERERDYLLIERERERGEFESKVSSIGDIFESKILCSKKCPA